MSDLDILLHLYFFWKKKPNSVYNSKTAIILFLKSFKNKLYIYFKLFNNSQFSCFKLLMDRRSRFTFAVHKEDQFKTRKLAVIK
jgi:hypothetical protein